MLTSTVRARKLCGGVTPLTLGLAGALEPGGPASPLVPSVPFIPAGPCCPAGPCEPPPHAPTTPAIPSIPSTTKRFIETSRLEAVDVVQARTEAIALVDYFTKAAA